MSEDITHINNAIHYLSTFLSKGLEHRPKEYKKTVEFLDSMQDLLTKASDEICLISDEFKKEHEEVDWKGMIIFNKEKIQQYLKENPKDFWNLVRDEVPGLLGTLMGLAKIEE